MLKYDVDNVPVYKYFVFCILRKDRQTGITVYGYIIVTEFGPLARQKGSFQAPH